MTMRLTHRGPDGAGFMVDGPVAFGHRRLAVIEPTPDGKQPMRDRDRTCFITFNGEIYNYRELREELISRGAKFRTRTDTEVLLEAYKAWGEGALERIDGMFALALWDRTRQRLLLARDRAGEKPLYYQALPRGGAVFASELPALQEHPAVSDRVDPRALGHYLELNYTLTSHCIIAGVSKLPAAHSLLLEKDRDGAARRYWDLAPFFNDKRAFASEDDAANELRALIDRSVLRQMVSDVPLGGFLSGGIDSSTVAASMCRARAASLNHTFSAGFREPTYSELDQAGLVARHLGVSHHELLVESDVAFDFSRIVGQAGEPFADTSSLAVDVLSRFSRRTVTVCLAGDGADEILAGYDTFVADRVHRAVRWLPRFVTRGLRVSASAFLRPTRSKVSWREKLHRFANARDLGPDAAHLAWRRITRPEERAALVRPEHKEVLAADAFEDTSRFLQGVRACHPIDRASYYDLATWLVDDILVKVDRFSMAHSLEVRAPFLSRQMMEFAARLPVEYKLRGFTGKSVLRGSQRSRLPPSVLSRAKRGFNAPVAHWLGGALQPAWRSVREARVLDEWLEASEMDRLWSEHQHGQADHSLRLYGMLVLGQWLQIARSPRPEPAPGPIEEISA
jgi:asparagine synthase (glutamine-hydrolysing)